MAEDQSWRRGRGKAWDDTRLMWLMVIDRALSDVRRKNPIVSSDNPQKVRAEAIRWVRSEDFQTVCDLAGVDSGDLRAIFDVAIEEKTL